MKYRVASICTGANGFDLALDDSRFEVVAHAELDKYAMAVLRHHYPKAKNYGDITQEDFAATLPDFDILTGGTPCQSFSVAGNQQGLDGKSGLFFSFIKILEERQPPYFVWENVKNATSVNRGLDFLIIQNAMAEAGYDIQWQVLNSEEFGAHQRRERIFIVGNLRGVPIKEVFFDTTYRSTYRQTILPESGPKEDCIENRPNFLMAYSRSMREEHIDHRAFINCGANTLTTGDGCCSRSTCNFIFNEDSIRKLTPLECERMMTWPDNWTKYGTTENGRVIELSDTQRYKMCGNGIVSIVPKQLMEAALP